MIQPDAKIQVAGDEFEVLAVSERGDGKHRVLKGQRSLERPFVVKTYGLKRGLWRTAFWWFGHRILVGKSSVTVSGRIRTEKEVLELWDRHGLQVPKILPLDLSDLFEQPTLVMEWIEGETLAQRMGDENVSRDEKRAWMKALGENLGHRHELALKLQEPRMIHEHPRLDHLLIDGQRLVTHDFEIVYTKRHRLLDLIGQELAGFLKSIHQAAGATDDEFGNELLLAFVENYPVRERFMTLEDSLARGSLPGMGLLHRWDAKKRLKSPRSKFSVARRVTGLIRERVAS